MLATLKKLKNILNDAGKNVKNKFTFQYDYYSYDKSLLKEKILYTCWGCHKIFTPYEGIDVITKEGKSLHYCDNCFTSLCNNVSWCEHCFQPFEPEEGKENLYCVNCLEELSNGF